MFLQVASAPKNFHFKTKKRDCFKCEIFVARTYSCYKAFGSKGKLESGLLAKVQHCLDFMEARLPDPGESPKSKKRKSDDNQQ